MNNYQFDFWIYISALSIGLIAGCMLGFALRGILGIC
jgi:hypothetical protein